MSLPPLHACLFHVIALCLICTVLLLTSLQVHKFVQGKTILAYNTEKHRSIPLPQISFCPGFKPGKVESSVWSRSFWRRHRHNESAFPTDEERVMSLWREVTYDLDEVLVGLMLFTKDGSIIDWNNKTGSSCFVVIEHGTWSGR